MSRKSEPRVVGLSCWQRTGSGGCRNVFNFTVPKGMKLIGKGGAYEEMERQAGRLGWVIGHFDGQGNYACPDCNTTVYDPVFLNVGERGVNDTSPIPRQNRMEHGHQEIAKVLAGSLDDGVPNHHDHTKRGFNPQ
jgi:hypothetical protein